jgi:urease gamma subunit
MRQERVLKVAKELARKGELEGLRLLVRAAALPLMAEAMLNWAANGRGIPHFLDHAIPESVIRAMEFLRVLLDPNP